MLMMFSLGIFLFSGPFALLNFMLKQIEILPQFPAFLPDNL